MTIKDDGGPAFPFNRTETECYCGMSMRDYFAAAAMQGLIASNDVGAGDRIGDIPDYAYQIADAMLEARKK